MRTGDEDELKSDDETGWPYQHEQPRDEGQHESVGMGPGRTGVKGVIRDHDEAHSTQGTNAR